MYVFEPKLFQREASAMEVGNCWARQFWVQDRTLREEYSMSVIFSEHIKEFTGKQ